MATKSTSPDTPSGVTAQDWAAGNGPLQVPLSGLLADNPSLQDALLDPEEWRARLDAYLKSPRP